MTQNPTYKELQQRIRSLEKDAAARQQAEEALQESEEKFRLAFENAVDAIYWANPETGLITDCNKAAETLLEKRRDEIIGQHQTRIHPPQKAEYYSNMFRRHIERKGSVDDEAEVITKSGKIIPVHITASVTLVGGKPIIQGIFRDITERKQAEEALMESTRRLQLAYEQAIAYAKELNKEIDVRKRAEGALQRRKEQLKAKAQSLKEMNTALKVLLKKREEDKIELEEKVLSNVEEIVLPYVEMLKNSRLSAEQMSYVSILESNLTGIVSPFLRKLNSKYLRLTPKEIQIADLIKLGKTTKQIGGLLNISIRAVEFHRANIRTKLGLKNKKANLSSFLFSL